MKVAIIGSRSGVPEQTVRDFVARLADKHPDVEIVSGGARGVDTIANLAGSSHELRVNVIPFSSGGTDRLAGKRRNWQIVREADEVVAFWDGWSNGTAHAVTAATAIGKRVWVYAPHGDLP